MKYLTKSGEMWDEIAQRELGSSRYMEALINANRHLIDTFIFGAGVELELPEIKKEATIKVPPWRVENGN